ncbi:MAG: hypothetical protein IKI75_05830 [Lachnospiraceae bacterium]|nr:hypothetical protein [Lachnospiraceae bacterium]
MNIVKKIVTIILLAASVFCLVAGPLFKVVATDEIEELTDSLDDSIEEGEYILDEADEDDWEMIEEEGGITEKDVKELLKQTKNIRDLIAGPSYSIFSMKGIIKELIEFSKWEEKLEDAGIYMFDTFDEETIMVFNAINTVFNVAIGVTVFFALISVLLVIFDKKAAMVPYLVYSILVFLGGGAMVLLFDLGYDESLEDILLTPGLGLILAPVTAIAATIFYGIITGKETKAKKLAAQQQVQQQYMAQQQYAQQYGYGAPQGGYGMPQQAYGQQPVQQASAPAQQPAAPQQTGSFDSSFGKVSDLD